MVVVLSEKAQSSRAWRLANAAAVEARNANRRRAYAGSTAGVRGIGRVRICAVCGDPFTAKSATAIVCSSKCKSRREDPTKLRARNVAKNHRRRALVVAGDVSSAEIADLLAGSGECCPLCGDAFTDGDSNAGTYRNVDHVVPLFAGGHHELENLRVVCRSCNISRPKDGSDLLVAA